MDMHNEWVWWSSERLPRGQFEHALEVIRLREADKHRKENELGHAGEKDMVIARSELSKWLHCMYCCRHESFFRIRHSMRKTRSGCRGPGRRCVFPLVIGQGPLAGAIRVHHKKLAIGLRKLVVEWRLIFES